MKLKKTEKGQILYIIAIALVALMAFTGLAVDGSTVYRARRTDQSAADAAALAGAGAAANYLKTYPGFACGSAIDVQGESLARARAVTAAAVFKTSSGNPVALANGDLSTGNGVVTNCATNTNGAAYITIQVKVSSAVNTYFFKVVSRTPIQTNVAATTKVTSSTLGSLLNGAGLASLAPTGCGLNITSTPITINGGGIFDNSDICGNAGSVDNGQRLTTNGGCVGVSGSISSNFTDPNMHPNINKWCTDNPQTQVSSSAISTMFSAIPIPVKPTCTTTAKYTWSDILNGSGGTYCFPKNYSLKLSWSDAGGGTHATQTVNGTVKLVFSGTGGFSINGGTYLTLNFGGLEMYFENGTFDAGGTAFAVPNAFRIYMMGTDDSAKIHFQGGSTDTFNDAFFYLGNGYMDIPGSVSFTGIAPAYGSYKGILIYQPVDNTTTWTINGGSALSLSGSVLAPGATLAYQGSTTTTVLNSQIVAKYVTIGGGSTLQINFDPNLNYSGSGQPLTIDVLH